MSFPQLRPGLARAALRLACVVAVATVSTPLLAAPPPMRVSEIRPGMTGYGLTVFEGSRIDTFSVRVLGVQENVRAQGSLVLVEVGGHGLERSSIAQGMSGSPVFLDGRFAGAVAFGWEGALSPIGGVTPAEEMLALPTQSGALPSPRSGAAPDVRALLGDASGGLAAELGAAAPAAAAQGDAVSAVMSAIPSGWPSPLDLAAALLEPLAAPDGAGRPAWLCRPAGALAGNGGGAGGGNIPFEEPARLRPGSACAVSLVRGDADLGAIGTVTWVDGDRVLMMGHPLLQRGPVELPLAAADIVTILPSRRMSFKLGSAGPVVGAVHHDLRAGLAGRLGAVAPTVPVSVRILEPGAGRPAREFRFDVARDVQLTPLLVFWSFYNALLAGGDDASRQSLDWSLRTTWRQPGAPSRELVLRSVAGGPGGAAALAGEVMAPLALLLDNPFGDVALESAEFRVTVAPGRDGRTITALAAPRRLEAGAGELAVIVDQREASGRITSVPVSVPLPASLAAGTYRVVAASAAEFFAFEAQRAPERLRPARLADLWELLATPRSSSTLVVAVFAGEQPALVEGRELAAAPGSVVRVLAAGRQPAEQALARVVARIALELPGESLAGHAVRSFEITAPAPAASDRRRP